MQVEDDAEPSRKPNPAALLSAFHTGAPLSAIHAAGKQGVFLFENICEPKGKKKLVSEDGENARKCFTFTK
jgi:hypothetical protein